MLELVALIIFFVGFIGMAVIIAKKMPALAELSPEKTKDSVFFRGIKKKGSLFMKGAISKTSRKTKNYLSKFRQISLENKDKFSDDFWKKIRGEK